MPKPTKASYYDTHTGSDNLKPGVWYYRLALTQNNLLIIQI